ncbi:Nn.00g047540.m01.CDS01 [Neocucurbitaria sp. VM-36]
MTVFASKEAFTTLGLEQITPSRTHASQDCTICLDPLLVHPTPNTAPASDLHDAVRILACGHLLGQECLTAWITVGNTCPVCNRLLFEASREEQAITQGDVDHILRVLGPVYGEDEVMGEVARLLIMQDERARSSSGRGGEVASSREEDVGVGGEFMLSGEDLWDSEEDGDGEFDWDDDGEEVVEEDEDYAPPDSMMEDEDVLEDEEE